VTLTLLLSILFHMQSVDYKCDVCGRVADLLPELEEKEAEAGDEQTAEAKSKYAAQIAQLHMHSLEGAAPANNEAGKTTAETGAADSKPPAIKSDATSNLTMDDQTKGTAPSIQEAAASSVPPPREEAAPIDNDGAVPVEEPIVLDEIVPPRAGARITRELDSVDVFLQYLTYAIVVALFALVYKKMLQVHGVLQ
jgi:hypothetical protein